MLYKKGHKFGIKLSKEFILWKTNYVVFFFLIPPNTSEKLTMDWCDWGYLYACTVLPTLAGFQV